MNTPGVMNALSSGIKNKKTLRSLRTVSKGFRERISPGRARTVLQRPTDKRSLQMISDSKMKINNRFNVMRRLPMFKHVGNDPRNYNNVLGLEGVGVWTKPQWVTYHSLGLQRNFQQTNNINSVLSGNYSVVRKGLRSSEQSQPKKDQIKQKIKNMKQKNNVKLTDFYNLMNMFTKKELMNIGY